MSRHAEPTWTTSTRADAIPPLGRSRDPVLLDGPHPNDEADVFFYELHEGDNEVFSDVLVVSESEWEPDEFFELVQTIRRGSRHATIQDTLSEAIASSSSATTASSS
jgi:hypothetical protein